MNLVLSYLALASSPKACNFQKNNQTDLISFVFFSLFNFESQENNSHLSKTFCSSGLCSEEDGDLFPAIVNLILARLDHQRLKRLDAFGIPGAGSPPDEHNDAANENSYGSAHNHGELPILYEHRAQFGGDRLVS